MIHPHHPTEPWKAWSVLWRSENKLDGETERLQGDCGELPLFATREECRAYIKDRYGYIRERPDLRKEPHGWKIPIPVRVAVTVEDAA